MRTLEQIVNAIQKDIQSVLTDIQNEGEFYDDYTVIVCPERIFFDDYLPKEQEYYERNHELPEFQYNPEGEPYGISPNESPYHNTVFVVVKMGTGQSNMAISNSNVTIEVLSEENDFMFAREILDRYVTKFNFKYDSDIGMVQAFFRPEMSTSQESIYAGFRALLSIRGFVRVIENGFIFVENIAISVVGDSGDNAVLIPFMSLSYSHTAQPDPQAFAGFLGRTKALNRQSTQIVTFETYMQTGNEDFNDLCREFILAQTQINKKFHIRLLTNIPAPDDITDPLSEISSTVGINGESISRVAVIDDYFVLTSLTYNQELGDMSTWAVSFTSALETENGEV